MKNAEKKNWKAPSIQSLSVKGITLSGTKPSTAEKGQGKSYYLDPSMSS